MKRHVRLVFCLSLAGIVVFLGSCRSRSISNSEYQDQSGWGYHSGENPYYQGELNELAVLGIEEDSSDSISEADIQAALAHQRVLTLKAGDAVVLIQSGAMFPDDPMLTALKEYFTIIPLGGIPGQIDRGRNDTEDSQTSSVSLNKVLRLAAARSGSRVLIVYWGILESGQRNQITKIVSWVPIVGSVIPDKVQDMRIRLKGVVMDVETGQWVMLAPDALEHSRLSARLDRETADQSQVALLKEQGYAAFVDELLRMFSIEKRQ